MCRAGPPLTFKVEQYSLGNDVRSSQKRPVDYAAALRTAPLVVLNNFGDGRQESPEARVDHVSEHLSDHQSADGAAG